MYEIMRYWDEDLPDWDAEDRDFAAVWRSQRKWVVSRSLKSVGPNATLIDDDLEAAIRGLKAQLDGEIDVAGPNLAGSLTNLGLIDEYRLYLHPIVLGRGTAILRRPPAAAPPGVQRSNRRGRHQVDVRSCLIARLARRTAPTRQIRFGSRPGIPACAPNLPRKRSHKGTLSGRCKTYPFREGSVGAGPRHERRFSPRMNTGFFLRLICPWTMRYSPLSRVSSASPEKRGVNLAVSLRCRATLAAQSHTTHTRNQ